jgi:hypothetical protein
MRLPLGLPMLAKARVVKARADIESTRTCHVAIAATRAAGATLVDPKSYATQGTATLHHVPDRRLGGLP